MHILKFLVSLHKLMQNLDFAVIKKLGYTKRRIICSFTTAKSPGVSAICT